MAMRVPTLTGRTVQAEGLAAPMMQANVTSADGGGLAAQGMIAVGQQVQDLGGMIRQHALKMAEDDAKTEAMAAYNDWQGQRVGLLVGNEDAYFRRSEEDAYKAAEGVNAALKSAWETRAASMTPQARKMIEQRVYQDLQGDAMSVARHATTEREKWRDTTAQATVQTMATEASLFYADPARRDAALKTGREVIVSRAKERGWAADDPRLKVEVANFESAALAGVLRRQAESDPLGAKAYLAEIGGRLTAADYAAASSLLEQKGRLHAVDAAVRDIKGSTVAGDYTGRLMQVEGDGQNPRSTASGVGQFTEGTWLDTVRRHAPETFDERSDSEVLALRKVPEFAARMLAGLRADNAKVLQQGGVQVNPQSEYLAHFLGAGDAVRVLKARPETPVEAVVQEQSRAANPEVFAKVRTAGDMQVWAAQKMAGVGDGAPSRAAVWEQQRVAAARITDPEIRAGVEAQLEREYRLGEATDAARRKAGQEEVYAQVLKGLNPDSVPPETQGVVGPDFIRQMRALYAANGQAPYNAGVEAVLQRAALDRNTFAAVDLTSLLGQHDTTRMDYWLDQQKKMGSSDPKDAARQTMRQPVYGTGLSIVQEQFPAVDGADLTAVERLARAAEQTRIWIDAFMDEKGQPPNVGEIYQRVRALKDDINLASIGQALWEDVSKLVSVPVVTAQGIGQVLWERAMELITDTEPVGPEGSENVVTLMSPQGRRDTWSRQKADYGVNSGRTDPTKIGRKPAETEDRPRPEGLPVYKGTTFFGGAGMEGPYIPDMVNALGEAGIGNARAADREKWSSWAGLYGDAPMVVFNNQLDPEEISDLSEFGQQGEQFNLIGYSHGSLVAARAAFQYAEQGGTVDHLVLIGSPFEEESLERLQNHPGIKRVLVLDLSTKGDKIHAGMSDSRIIRKSFGVGRQFPGDGVGHFYYSEDTEIGRARRKRLAHDLYEAGLR